MTGMTTRDDSRVGEQPDDDGPATGEAPPTALDRSWFTWVVRVVAAAAVLVVVWACVTEWGGVIHGYPLYAILLLATLVGSAVVGRRSLGRPRQVRSGWRRAVRVVLVVAAIGWIALMAWLRPFSAQQPALGAMRSDATVSVAEYPTQIVMTPIRGVSPTGVFFQPGARVDARAYAAVLRPLATAGYTVIIPKQPVGIAFLAITAFGSTRAAHPEITRWVVGGHSLGGTVAAIQADSGDTDPRAPVVGLLFYASYPAGDISASLTAKVMSIYGTRDGLATPSKVMASRGNLPTGATFTRVDGAVHSFFGDYGPQPGDGSPTISHDDARTQVSRDSVDFVASLSR